MVGFSERLHAKSKSVPSPDFASGNRADPPRAPVNGAAGSRPPVSRFVGIGVNDPIWGHSTFSKNRQRLLEGDVAVKLLSAVLAQPRVKRPLSRDHFFRTRAALKLGRFERPALRWGGSFGKPAR
jgi:hypothetical protein